MCASGRVRDSKLDSHRGGMGECTSVDEWRWPVEKPRQTVQIPKGYYCQLGRVDGTSCKETSVNGRDESTKLIPTIVELDNPDGGKTPCIVEPPGPLRAQPRSMDMSKSHAMHHTTQPMNSHTTCQVLQSFPCMPAPCLISHTSGACTLGAITCYTSASNPTQLVNLPCTPSLSVMVASYLPSSYLISASILSNLGAHLISYLIYGCGLVSS